jgi:hypothetical protein
MVKEINFSQNNPKLGKIKGTLRIIGKNLYIKVNPYKHANELIQKYKSSGCEVKESKDWIMINLFHTHKNLILGGINLDSSESDKELEEKLFKFYIVQYAKAGIKIEVKDG